MLRSTVTGISKFGKDPDRENQPGLEIEGTGEIQAYRTVNMMNGATVSYDETVEMPWSDSSNKVPNTAWVQQAVQHGTIDPNSELTVKKISTTTGGAFLNASHTTSNGSKYQAYLSVHKATSDADDSYIEAAVYSSADSVTSSLHLHTLFARLQTPILYFDGGNKSAGTEVIRLGQASGQAYQTTRYLYCEYPGRFVNGLQVGFINDADADGIPFKILRSDNTTIGKWIAAFGVTPTVPDITDAADASDKVPNTKWVQAAIAAGGGGGGTGAVSSVNGKTGAVVLSGQDIKTDPNATNTIYQDWAELSSQISGKQSAIVQDSSLSLNSITLANSSTGTVGTLKLTSQDGAIEFRPNDTYLGGIIGRSGEGILITGNDLHIGYQFSSPTGILVSRTNSKTTHNFATEFTNTVSCSADIAASDNSQQLATTQWVNAAIAAAGGGGGSGAVTSVNGKTGEVVLSASDVGAASSSDLASYVTTDAMNTELTNFATTASVDTKLADYQRKLIAGDGISISESNVISVTGGTGGAVSSVNGKTGEVVLNASDVGAITGAEADTKITTALEPYAKTADVTTTLEPYAKSADVTAEINAAVAPLATTESLNTGLAGKQDKLTAGSGIAISDTNVISATVSSPVDSVNGKTGAVVLSGEDIRLHPTVEDYVYPAVSDVIDTISDYMPEGVSYDNKLVDNSSLQTHLATYQPKLTAGEGITISAENVISATGGSGGGAVTSVNGNTGAVVLTGDNIMTASDSTTSLNSALAGKQASITAETDLTVGSLTAGSADSGLYAGRYSIRFTSNGNDKLFVDATGPYISNLTGGDLGPATGAFNWYINTTTDYNKFNVFNRYHVTNEETHEVTTNDTSVLSIGGSPTDHSTWIDFTATYMSFKGNTNFGEAGMDHAMTFNGPSTFTKTATFHELTAGDGYAGTMFTCNTDAWLNFDNRIGWTSGRLRCARTDDDFMFDFNHSASAGQRIRFNDTVTILSAMPAAADSSTTVPTTAWVQSAITTATANAVTTNTVQTIIASKKISTGATIAYSRPFEILMPTSNESNPTENKTREIAFISSEGTGNNYEGSLTHTRFATGESYTGLRAGRLVNGTYKEGTLGVHTMEDGTTFGTAPSTPANPTSDTIATAGYVKNQVATKANTNADNFSVAGKSVLSGMGMPSKRYINLTLGASGSTYTAPANGWFSCVFICGATGGHVNAFIEQGLGFMDDIATNDATKFYLPVLKGDTMRFNYPSANTSSSDWYFQFIYAEGESNV